MPARIANSAEANRQLSLTIGNEGRPISVPEFSEGT